VSVWVCVSKMKQQPWLERPETWRSSNPWHCVEVCWFCLKGQVRVTRSSSLCTFGLLLNPWYRVFTIVNIYPHRRRSTATRIYISTEWSSLLPAWDCEKSYITVRGKTEYWNHWVSLKLIEAWCFVWSTVPAEWFQSVRTCTV